MDGQSFQKCPGEAGHDAVILAQLGVGFLLRVPARERYHPHDLGMADAVGIEVVLIGHGDAESYLQFRQRHRNIDVNRFP
jgi:hypothetical protein